MSTDDKQKAVILLSGGLDSKTVLAIAKELGFACYALSFDYGQRHIFELEAAQTIARRANVCRHLIQHIDLRAFGGSALTDDINVPKGQDLPKPESHIPVTYVPARNTIFLSFALAWAETLKAHDIFIGANVLDYSGYPDCRPDYLKAFEQMAALATRTGVEKTGKIKIKAPLIRLSKGDIIRKGTALGVDYRDTISCYDPPSKGVHCGECDACHLRKKGFAEAKITDPTSYAAYMT